MTTPHAAAAGLNRTAQKTHRAGVVILFRLQLFHTRLSFVGEQFGNNHSILVVNPLRRAETDHLFRLQLNGQLGGNFFRGQIEAFAGDGNGNRAHQHDSAVIQLAMDRLFINTADAPAMAIIHAVVDAQRLSDNKVAAHHVDMGALQRGIIQAH